MFSIAIQKQTDLIGDKAKICTRLQKVAALFACKTRLEQPHELDTGCHLHLDHGLSQWFSQYLTNPKIAKSRNFCRKSYTRDIDEGSRSSNIRENLPTNFRMPAVKRRHAELEAEEQADANELGLLARLRNDWRLANIMQWLYLFGKEYKIDEDLDMEDLEEECLKPTSSERLADLGLRLLRHISSHRGLTSEIFDEYTRRQYLVRRPNDNPFGEEEEPNQFASFDIFTKLKVLHQLTMWVMSNPERFREKMPETREMDQTQWRIEEFGWDSEDRAYYVLDDNRLYRRTRRPPPPPDPPKSKAKSKAPARPRQKGTRASKRRKVVDAEEAESPHEEITEVAKEEEPGDNGLGGDKWECLCVTLEDYQKFLFAIKKSRDPNEKVLYKRLAEDVIPVIEKLEEDRARKIAKREKELLTLEKLATAKRSSRIATRVEKEKEEEVAREAEERHKRQLMAARQEAKRQKEMEEARESRMMTREQRLKEREYKRVLHEEELKKMAEEEEKIRKGEIESKKSERHLKAEIKRAQDALDELNEEEDWVFDCSRCGVYGQNIDDGKHSIACERCNVWQHSECLNLSEEEAEEDDFHFICEDCQRKEEEARQREEDAKKPKIPPLKFKVGLSSPPRPASQNGVHVAVSPAVDMETIVVQHPKPMNQTNEAETKRVKPPEMTFKPYIPKSYSYTKHHQQNSHSPLLSSKISDDGGSIRVSENLSMPSKSPASSREAVKISRSMELSNGSPSLQVNSGPGRTSPVASPSQSIVNNESRASHVPQTPKQEQQTIGNGTSGSAVKRTPSLSGTQIPRMPPPQATPGSSFASNGHTSSFESQGSFPSTPAHPHVPLKQQSSAPSPIPKTSLKESSPAIEPPLHLSSEAKVSGLSPVKNSSPPQPSSQANSSVGPLDSQQNIALLP